MFHLSSWSSILLKLSKSLPKSSNPLLISMQEAIFPYNATTTHHLLSTPTTGSTNNIIAPEIGVSKLVVENAVAVLGRRGCCMCHVVKRLLLCHGVNPAAMEVEEAEEAAVVARLSRIVGEDSGEVIQLPTVFVGGKLLGGIDRVMAAHISWDLVPVLKHAGALWL